MSNGFHLEFTVPGSPEQLRRHRSAGATDRAGNAVMKNGRPVIHHYDPAENRAAKHVIKIVAHNAMNEAKIYELYELPLAIRVTFYLALPQSKQIKNPHRVSEETLLRKSFPMVVPDLDNYEKLIADACEGVVFKNDAQICTSHTAKRYTVKRPRTEVIFFGHHSGECGMKLIREANDNLEIQQEIET